MRLRQLRLRGGDVRAADVAAHAADLAAHPSLRELELWHAPLATHAALDALVDAALALRLTKLELHGCRVGTASAVAPTSAIVSPGFAVNETSRTAGRRPS